MEYTTAFDIGKRKRQQGGINEDSVAVNIVEEGHRDADRRAGVFVLADGAGGADAGDVASYVTTVEVTRRLTETLWNARRAAEVLDLDPEGARAGSTGTAPDVELDVSTVNEPLAEVDAERIRDRIEQAIRAAQDRLIEVIDDLGVESAYSTVVAGVKAGDALHYGWVGDSRIYAVSTAPTVPDEERVQLLTRDHSVVEQLVEQGEIDEIEAYVHRRGNRITRALGGARREDPSATSVDVDTNSVPLFRDDVVLLTSDGLVDAYVGAPQLHQHYEQAEDTAEIEEAILEKSVTEDEIRDVITAADSLALAGERFVSLSNERGGKDNVSVILFRDPDLPQTPSSGPPDRAADRETTDPDTGTGGIADEERATGDAVEPTDSGQSSTETSAFGRGAPRDMNADDESTSGTSGDIGGTRIDEGEDGGDENGPDM